MIEVRGLSKEYEDPDGGLVQAVNNVSLTARRGEVYGLLGPNGAGKTTTLRCLATILTPTAGTAEISGYDLLTEPEDVRRSIGFLTASTGLYGRLTPRETLRFFAALHGWSGDRREAQVERTLGLFQCTEYADRPNERLSTGMKQRVSLARAVVHDPPVLILDEPTTGLDPVVGRAVEESISGLAASGKCVLFSTHDLQQADALCARLGIIVRGQVVAEGTVEEICTATGTSSLREAFFALAKGSDL